MLRKLKLNLDSKNGKIIPFRPDKTVMIRPTKNTSCKKTDRRCSESWFFLLTSKQPKYPFIATLNGPDLKTACLT